METTPPPPGSLYAAPQPAPGRSRALLAGIAAAAVLGTSAVAFGAGTLVAGASAGDVVTDNSTVAGAPAFGGAAPEDGSAPDGTAPEGGPGGSVPDGSGQWSPGPSDGSGSTSKGTTTATEDQQAGLVYISTVVGYDQGEAAGTGMVLSSDGEVLTNHHVVAGATEIQVEVAATGATYDAEVQGYDAATDVALLQLDDAADLATVTTDTDEPVEVGDAVTGVGNAGGQAQPSAAAGTVTGLDESITVSDELGGSEQLTDLIEIDADIISGDSGGPLYDDDTEVVGMNTAASSGSVDITGYAIPIATALDIADQIASGEESADVHIGATAFLGVTLAAQPSTGAYGDGSGGYGGYGDGAQSGGGSPVSGAPIAGVVDGTAAAEAGLAAGDTITAIDGTRVGSADELSEAIASYDAGDSVALTWTDASGQTHSADATLGEGPVG